MSVLPPVPRGESVLTDGSDNAVVSRGVKAITIIYNMTSRIPHLMKQSHLESSEGRLESGDSI